MSGPITPGTTVKQALEAVVPGKVFYALEGTNTGNGAAKVGIAVIGETPYSEGCGDLAESAVHEPALVDVAR